LWRLNKRNVSLCFLLLVFLPSLYNCNETPHQLPPPAGLKACSGRSQPSRKKQYGFLEKLSLFVVLLRPAQLLQNKKTDDVYMVIIIPSGRYTSSLLNVVLLHLHEPKCALRSLHSLTYCFYLSVDCQSDGELRVIKVRQNTFHLVVPREKRVMHKYNKPTLTSNSGSQGRWSWTQPSMNNTCSDLLMRLKKRGHLWNSKQCEETDETESKWKGIER